MKQRLITGFWIVIAGLLGAGILVLANRPPAGEPITLLPPPTEAPLVVQVSGAVDSPGVYSLPQGSRMQDAIQAAGGLLPAANPDSLNFAAALSDGQKIVVPETAAPVEPGQRSESLDLSSQSTPAPGELVNINTASQVQLETLPGIGPVLAADIIAYREANGPFQNPEDILKVPGIGPAKLEGIRDLITLQ